MFTIDTPYLITYIFLHVAVKKKFPILSLVRYLFKVVSGYRYVTRGSSGNILSITLTGSVPVATYSNQTSFGFCHGSLNSLSSVKAT